MRQKRTIVTLVLIVGLGFAVAAFVTATKGQSGDSTKAAAENQSKPVMSDASGSPLLASRYHQRTRTKRFFKRSTRPYRSRSITPVSKPGTIKSKPVAPKSEILAGRYHQRTRTAQFFRRGIA